MKTVNERLLDGQLNHAVNLQQYSTGVVRRIIALLNRTDPDLVAQLAAALERLSPESFTVQRLEDLLLAVRTINAQAYRAIGEELAQDMRALTEHEVGFQYDLFRSTLPQQVSVASVDVTQVYAAALNRPWQGRLLSEWAQTIEADRMARIRDAVRIGYVQQQTIPQIVQRLRGTRARGYADGLLEIDRRSAESVVRTAVSHFAGSARDGVFKANSDLIAAEQWISTLDSRTSELCRIRDRLKYTAGDHKPIGHKVPWLAGPGRLHWCCRSSSTPVTKSWKAIGINLPEFAPTERASMDGAVAAEVNYSEWFAKQSAARQDQIVGPTRGALYRRGGISFERFYTDKGVALSLEQLKERDAAAFTRAGV